MSNNNPTEGHIRYLSLFSGIEAASVAWQPLGWEAVAFAQYEPGDNIQFPSKVLAYHFPDVPNLGDVTKITEEQIAALGHIDLVVGGSPCQDLSVAGKRAGLRNEDGSLTRSGLFDYQVQIYEWAVKNNGCRFMLYENVPGAFSSNGGNDFGYILGSMVKRDVSVPRDGWKDSGVCISETGDRIVEWTVLNSADLGVPQRRKRVFALCDSGAWWSRPPILFESEGLSRHFKESEGTFEGSPSSIGKHSEGNGCNTYGWMPRCLQSSPSRDVAQPLTATDYKDPSIVGYQENIGALCASGHKMISNQYVADDKCIVESALAIRTSNTKANGNGISMEAHSLDCNQPEAVAYKLDSIASNAMKSSNPNSGFHKEDVCCTLDTSDQNPVRNQGGMAIVQKGLFDD